MKSNIQWLKPKKGKSRNNKPFMFADIETFGKASGDLHGKFCIGVVYWRKGEYERTKVFDTLPDMFNYIVGMQTPRECFFWNLNFDGKFMLSELSNRDLLDKMAEHIIKTKSKTTGKTRKVIVEKPMVELIENSGRWLAIQIRDFLTPGHKTKLMDGMNYYPMSLDSAIKQFGIPFAKIPVDFDSVYPGSPEIQRLIDHCVNDCKAGYELVKLYYGKCQEVGIKAQLTSASTAMELLKVNCLDDTVPLLPKAISAFVRRGYYGGRCEVYHQLDENECYCYDVNSLYPSTYRYKLPFRFPYMTKPKPEDIATLDKLGFAEVIIDIPEQPIAPLPYRLPEGKLIFPTGILKGVWFTEELKEAINYYGGKVLEVKRAILWGDSKDILRKYADTTETLKTEAKTEGDRGVAKLWRNSLYGKFGERSERREVHFEPIPESIDWLSVELHDTEEIPYWVILKEARRGHHLVQLGAAITAYARRDMLRYMRMVNWLGVSIHYTDTDSMITDQVLPDSLMGKEDGLLKLEHHGQPFIGLAPKVYYLGKNGGETTKVKIKGFPPNECGEKEFREALAGRFDALTVSWLREDFDFKASSVRLIENSRQLRYLDTKRQHSDVYSSKPLFITDFGPERGNTG